MTERSIYLRLADTLKIIDRERAAMRQHAAVSGDMNQTPKRRETAAERANACSRELGRLSHEAHCLAVEIGLAELRTADAYKNTTASLGLGRDLLIDRRSPNHSEQDLEMVRSLSELRDVLNLPECSAAFAMQNAASRFKKLNSSEIPNG